MWLYIVLGVITLIFYVVKSLKYDHWEKLGVPTASGNELLFGHYKPVFFLKKNLNDLYIPMYREFPDAPMVGYYIMGAPGLLIRDLDLVKSIIVTEFPSFNFNGFHIDKQEDILAASNPFILVGDEWKAARTHVTPALSLAKLKGYLPIILDVGDEMVKYVKHNSTGGLIELEAKEVLDLIISVTPNGRKIVTKLVFGPIQKPKPKLIEKFTTDAIANAIYGIKNNTFEDKNSLFAQLTREIIFEFSIKENFKMFLQQIPGLRRYFPARFTGKRLQDIMLSLTRKIIEQRTSTGEKRNDVHQILMTLKENDTKGVFTVEYMTGLVFTIITDLYDTASGMTSLILCTLSRHPEIQEKLRSEIKQIKEKNNGNWTIEDIENAKYLDMVFNETFRMNSFLLFKECTQDCYLPIPGSEPFKVTKGTSIIIPVAGIHRDPKYYPEPDKFDPERFSDEEVAKRPKFSFMPFGEGPRKCMGVRIVTMEIKVAIIKILDSFRVKPSPKTEYPFVMEPTAVIPIRPINGAWALFEEIK